jgi:hypothetical protein
MELHDWSKVSDSVFHDFHLSWIARLKETLNAGLLPSGYHARAEQSFAARGRRYSDILALKRPNRTNESKPGRLLAVDDVPPIASVHSALMTPGPKQRRVAIRESAEDNIVALIELVSGANKDRAVSVETFVQKIAGSIDAGIQVTMIDLLPPTRWVAEGFHKEIIQSISRVPSELNGVEQSGPTAFLAYEVGEETLDVYADYPAPGAHLPATPLFLLPGWYVPLPLAETYAATVQAMSEIDREALGA